MLKQYNQHINSFLEVLIAVAHLTGGQLARGPKILSIRFRNTPKGLRNVFIDIGLIMLGTSYHKGYIASRKLKVIHRFLPEEVGILLVYYL
jgi:hypothetical protein